MSEPQPAAPTGNTAARHARGVPARAGFGALFGDLATQHTALIIVFIAALRLPYFGNPAIYIDEQFYLLVADRWVHQGLLPYVDIWDRKPIGVFIIYALGQMLGDPVLGYQILATLAAVATALLLYATATLVWPRIIGLYAALFYGVTVMLMDGQGGQTPVYYNALVAGAAYLLLRLAVQPRPVVAASLGAALLLGLALQIKYAAAFEAAGLCLFALTVLRLRRRWPYSRLLALAIGMMMLGLAPTGLVWAVYAALGHGQAFLFANFLSILAKDSWRQSETSYAVQFLRASRMGVHLLVPAASFLAGLRFVWRGLSTAHRWMLSGLIVWLACTFIGALVMGKPAEHYFLPTLVPLSLLAALGIERLATHDLPLMRRFALTAPQATAALFGTILALSTLTAFVTVHETKVHWGAPALITRSADYLRDRLKGRCLYVYKRLPIYYYLTNACAPTPYVFPNHLNDSAELHALPVDALGEFARVLQAKPVLLVRIPITSETDPAAEEMLNQALTRDYVLDRMFAGDHQTINVYVPRPAK